MKFRVGFSIALILVLIGLFLVYQNMTNQTPQQPPSDPNGIHLNQ